MSSSSPFSPSDSFSRSPFGRRDFLRTAVGAAAAAAVGHAATKRPPNVVIIFCDDLGYGDLGSYGSSIPTPNIDSIGSSGVRFTSCLTANPVCSPSRAGLLTGRYPTRVGVPRVLFPADKGGLSLEEKTLANVLKDAGYKNKAIGKWHLGHHPEYLPTARGFDEYFGIPYSNDMNPRLLLHNTEVVQEIADLEKLTPQYTQQATDFIKANAKNPFFLYMAHTYPHIPLGASERFKGKSKEGIYGDVLQELDWSTGEILKTLKESGLEKDTLVLFSSDNGPWFQGSPGRLRGRKGTTYEGGMRVPLLARWTGQIPAGRTSNSLVSLMDVFPTVTKLAGGTLPTKPLDGVDAWPLLSGQAKSLDRDALLYFDNWEIQAARLGPWKLHLSRHNADGYSAQPAGGRLNLKINPELYNLDLDVDESYDVAPDNPTIVADIRGRVEKLLPTFPQEVRDAWSATQQRPSFHYTPGVRPQSRDPRDAVKALQGK